MDKLKKFNKICQDIKNLKIQGAENVAIAALQAYHLNPTKRAVKKLISLRPTEPCLRNALKFAQLSPKNISKAIAHFHEARDIIARYATRKIKDNMIIFTHCHSSTVMYVLAEAKRQGKKFIVRNTETRPLFQGRITSKELAKLKIPNTHFVDSALRLALKKADLVLLGADAITAEGKVINKIGSELVCLVADRYDVPVYICADSWKFDPATLYGTIEPIEYRSAKEIWKNPPKETIVVNPAFEKIAPELITGIISELGILAPEVFVTQVKKAYPWMFKNEDGVY